MITDIPTHKDFEDSGITFLNMAWDYIQELLFQLDDAGDWITSDDVEIKEEYWNSAQKKLITSLVFVQQATELLLKGKIAAVSPFLLIASDTRNWPRGCEKNNTPFVDFRTIDAQDLIKVYDTVSSERLDPSFIQSYHNSRVIRNKAMHSVDKRLIANPIEVILSILQAYQVLIEPNKWIAQRREYLENCPTSILYSTDHVGGLLARELILTSKILSKNEVKIHFGINEKVRKYICPRCSYGCCDFLGYPPRLAQLLPNSSTSINLHCYLCGEDVLVERKKCIKAECQSNVLDPEDQICLLCGQPNQDVVIA
jgi:hypothetical protein